MAPLVLEGDTLGKKHRHFNKLVNEAIVDKTFDGIEKLEEKSDIDKLFKIDLAAKCRNVDYILETFKSEDMLYVSRAIKRSPWLISDSQYSNIVNPNYLHEKLFPCMMSPAVSKFLLNVRLNLKEEPRVDEFFKYYESHDFDKALKWLPHCSRTVINEATVKYHYDINDRLFKRLCEKSFDVLEFFVKNNKFRYYSAGRYLKIAMFLMNTETDRFLDIFEKIDMECRNPKLGVKYTQLIMTKSPKRVVDNFHKYAYCIDIPTFVKYYGKNNIQNFLLKQRKNKKLESWFNFDNIKPFVKLMPKEGKFDFLKKVFVDKTIDENEDNDEALDDCYAAELCSAPAMGMACQSSGKMRVMKKSGRFVRKHKSSKNIYQCYRHAPPEIAIPELKKLIRSESSPDERIAMLIIMLGTAGSNLKTIQTVLQYFHDKHINEPFRYKIQFINYVISTTNTHRYDEACWKILDVLFRSSDVYIESSNNVQNCCEAIILYNLLHNQEIPEIIKTKFKFTTYKKKISKLNDEEKEKLFSYLYNDLEKKICQQVITNQEEFYIVVRLVSDTLDLLSDWKKELLNYPSVLAKIKELISLMKEKSWRDSALIYTFISEKKLKRHLFEESLLLSPSEDVFMNALKHDPQLLKRYPTEVDTLRYNDKVNLTRILKKLRIYWTESLASEWIEDYRSRLQQAGGHAAVTRGLFTLLTTDQVVSIVKEYAPTDDKINWNEADELKLSLQKQIAKNMYVARPQPSPDAVLLYAKGDYLQFALSSLSSIFYNMSSVRSRDHIPKLIHAPVSIQKHGIRLAFEKLNYEEVKQILTDVWKSTKNASIRAVIFELTYRLLCNEKQDKKADELWQLLEVFIDNLSDEENKSIYKLMEGVAQIPQHVQAKFLMKCYKFLKALPAKAECGDMVRMLGNYTVNLMDSLDPDFIQEMLLEHIDSIFVKDNIVSHVKQLYLNDVIAMYILSSGSEDCQQKRYEIILYPLMKNSFARWNEKHENTFTIRKFLKTHLEELSNQLQNIISNEKRKIVPVKLFKTIHGELKKALPAEHYVFLKMWELNSVFAESLEEVRDLPDPAPSGDAEGDDGKTGDSDGWTKLCCKLMPVFANKSLQILKNDLKNQFPSIYTLFSEALKKLFYSLNVSELAKYELFEAFLCDKDFVYSHLIVLQMIPLYQYDKETEKRAKRIRELIQTNSSEEVKMHCDLSYFFEFE